MASETDKQAAIRIAKEREASQEAQSQPLADAIATLAIFAVIAAAILVLLK